MQAFGINVPRMVTLTYGFGVALAAFAGVLAAPIYSVNPQMGTNLIIVVFAVVVIGGMGSILGAIITGFGLGIVEGLTKVFYPEASATRDLRHHGDRARDTSRRPVRKGLIMADTTTATVGEIHAPAHVDEGVLGRLQAQLAALLVMVAFLAIAPFFLYPVFLMKVLCFALFACAFNLLIGYVGLLSFGHAAYFGMGGYLAGHAAKVWGLSPELAILSGALVAAALGAVAGWLAIRRQGIYFAMITLALAQMIYFFCVQAPFTGGEDGIQGVPRGNLFGLIPLDQRPLMYWWWRRSSSPASC